MSKLSRRQVMSGLAVLGLGVHDLPWMARASAQAADDPALAWPQPVTGISEAYPTHDAIVALEVVGASHGRFERVKELVSQQPSLAKASWDWGFGDWETALGAAAHTGQHAIAEYLTENGAHPTLFSAAMLGQLDVVRATIEARPGVQRQPGPHGIPLLAHARAGGAVAARVAAYLEELGGANERIAVEPLSAADRASLVGRYTFGAGPRDAFVVDDQNEQVGFARVGTGRRVLRHLGAFVFTAGGAEAIRIRFTRDGARVTGFTISDPGVVLEATRRP
jgi:hypothetical protein